MAQIALPNAILAMLTSHVSTVEAALELIMASVWYVPPINS